MKNQFKIALCASIILINSCTKDPDTYYPKDGLVSYLSFDSGLTDEKGALTSISGSGSFVSGKNGQALKSSAVGTGSAVISYNTNTEIQSLNTFTISFWSRLVTLGSSIEIGIGSKLAIGQYNINNKIERTLWIYNPDIQRISDQIDAVGSWFHIVGVYTGTEAKLYVNGSLVQSKVITGKLSINTNPFKINTIVEGSLIDEILLYNRVLTDAEILKLYTF